MPLNSEARSLLDLMEQIGAPPLDALPPAEARAALGYLYLVCRNDGLMEELSTIFFVSPIGCMKGCKSCKLSKVVI